MHNADDEDSYVIERVAHCVIEAMREPFDIDGETLRISASIGITHYPKDAHDVESLLKHADQAMYEAKRLGRNRFVYFSQAMQVRAQKRRRIADDLRLAIKRRQLHVHYQPIVELSTGRIVKAEALLRWQHADRGWICPSEFIPLAEETGLIVDIGEWVFQVAVSDAARWRLRHGISIQVGVNVSPVQIANGQESCGRCIAFLESQRLPAHAIAIEITEGSLLQNDETVMHQLQQLANHGVALSIDDFGTGYSALSYLQNYRFDFLKIDRAFVRNMQKYSTKFALCKTMIAMAHALGMRVIAEGIEDMHEADLLKDAGCDYGQGYQFHQPMPAARLEQLLLSR
jgi:EAL domain-containing protein (putative c-di-GMP-specific phosphodiesterase class I)